MNLALALPFPRHRSFHALPIRIKLLIVVVGACALALLLSTALETILTWKDERQTLRQRLEVTAQMLALQSRAPLEFLDPKAAYENLSALEANPTVRKACLYNEGGATFAAYDPLRFTRHGQVVCPPARPQWPKEERWDELKTYQTITHNGRRLGSIYLERGLDDMYERMQEQMQYKLLIVLSVVLLVWMFSFYFQRHISEPIMELAHLSRLFSQDRSRPIQAVKRGEDELGELVDAFNDMTGEIQRNEQQLGEAIAELTRSNTELERFAHICSHDLQEPLRMVSNYAVLLERSWPGPLDENTRAYLHFITDGATRMRELIRDILAYARISRHVEPMAPVNLDAQVEYVLQNLSASITERGATIRKDELPEIRGNKTLLIQIFQNLISNAIKFCTQVPEVHLRAVRREKSWEFSVTDNGIGIDPKYHDKIFEIFKRLNRREEFGGTGIGLAIVKKAVQYHGGRVWVESQVGRGTTFFFTIPDSLV